MLIPKENRMKCAQFNFSHPVKGHACLTRLPAQQSPRCRCLEFDTGDSNDPILPLDDFAEGKWKVMLEWEYEKRYFTYSKEIELLPERNLFPAAKFANASLFHSKGALFSANEKYVAA